MTKEELAEKMNGVEMGSEDTFQAIAKEHGLLVVFGYSDDNMEFIGLFNDEYGCYEGGTALIDKEGVLPDRDSIDEDDDLEDYFIRKGQAKKIKAVWDPKKPECSWIYKTDIPHATFDVLEGGELYCRGIVIDGKDL